MTKKVIKETRFSKSSAESWCKFLTKKYSCEIISPPAFDEQKKIWCFSYHDPMLDD